MTTKKNLVKSMFMNILTAGIFAFGFSSCSDDDFESPVNNNAADNAQVASNEDGIRKPYGLVYTDFINSNDVQILNADTTMISVSKVYADKMGITDFVNHPMGIWQSLEERAYLRRATAQRLENGKYILNVVRSGLGEVLAGQDVVLNTGIYMNPNAGANTRGAAGIANKYTDGSNRIHPVTVAVTRRAGATTRGSFNQYGVLTAEQILNGENFNLPRTRGLSDAVDEFVKFVEYIEKNGATIKGEGSGTMLEMEGTLTPPKINIKTGNNKGDTVTINSKIPYKVQFDYTLKLDSKAELKSLSEYSWDDLCPIKFSCDYFEGRLDGSLSVAPQMTFGISGKAELPKEYQNKKIGELTEITFTFMVGYVPVAITIQPAIYLHMNLGVKGQVYTGIKYEYANEFSAGVKYDKKHGGWKPIADYKTKKNDFGLITPRGGFSVEAEAGVLLGADVLVDFVAGPTLSVGPLVKAGLKEQLAPFEKNPFTFEVGVKAGIYGRAGAKVKLWKLELFDWETELTFGPEWDIWSYKYDGKDSSSKGGNSELAKQIEDLKNESEAEAKAAKEKVAAIWNGAFSKLNEDPEVKEAVEALRNCKNNPNSFWSTYEYCISMSRSEFCKVLHINANKVDQYDFDYNYLDLLKKYYLNNLRGWAKKFA